MQESMTARRGYLRSAVDALLLREDVFRDVLHEPRPFVRGLVFVLIIAFVVALASLVGTGLSQWTSPDLGAIREAVSDGMRDMPWYLELDADVVAEVEENIERGMDIGFGIAEMFMPSMAMAFGSLLLMPLAMVFSWLMFGLVVHVVASLLEGEATLSQTYGAVALAVAPQILGVVNVLPGAQTAGLTIWSIVCAYVAVKHVHRLPANRTFWVLLISMAVVAVVAAVIGTVVGIIVAAGAFASIGAGS